jgi:hypothetical protein
VTVFPIWRERERESQTAILYKEELSKLHRIPIPTLNYWRHVGYGPPSFKIGGKVVYRVEDVDRHSTL